MSEQRPTCAVALVALLLVSPLLYMASYLAMVDEPSLVFGFPPQAGKVVIAPTYRAGGELAEYFFYPAYVVDRTVRPSHWTATVTIEISY